MRKNSRKAGQRSQLAHRVLVEMELWATPPYPQSLPSLWCLPGALLWLNVSSLIPFIGSQLKKDEKKGHLERGSGSCLAWWHTEYRDQKQESGWLQEFQCGKQSGWWSHPVIWGNTGQICLLLYFWEKLRENEFSFGDAEFQELEGLSFIHLTNLWWQPAVMTEGHFF